MKHLRLLLWTSVLVTACLPAQAQDAVRVKVPFDFTAGTKHLSAGEYLVSKSLPTNDTAWTIRNVANGEGAIVATTSVESPVVARQVSLMFRYREGQYSLYQLWLDEHQGRIARSSSKIEYQRLAHAETVEVPATKGN